MDAEDEPHERHINIHISPEIMAGVYANFANVSHSDYEFTITFARVDHEVDEDEVPGVVVSRVNLSPRFMRELIDAMEDNYSKWRTREGIKNLPEFDGEHGDHDDARFGRPRSGPSPAGGRRGASRPIPAVGVRQVGQRKPLLERRHPRAVAGRPQRDPVGLAFVAARDPVLTGVRRAAATSRPATTSGAARGSCAPSSRGGGPRARRRRAPPRAPAGPARRTRARPSACGGDRRG